MRQVYYYQCKECGREFQPGSARQKYCGLKCKGKVAERTRAAKHKESRRAYQRKHYAKHREGICTRRRGNPDVRAAARRSYYRHRGKRLAGQSAYQKKNKDRVNAYHRSYEKKVKQRKIEMEFALLTGILQGEMAER
jgi:hypothetical protein